VQSQTRAGLVTVTSPGPGVLGMKDLEEKIFFLPIINGQVSEN